MTHFFGIRLSGNECLSKHHNCNYCLIAVDHSVRYCCVELRDTITSVLSFKFCFSRIR